MQVSSYVDEGDAVAFVAEKLNISYSEAEELYTDVGGYQGHPVSFDTRWPNDDPFSKVMQEFMTERGIVSLQAQYDD